MDGCKLMDWIVLMIHDITLLAAQGPLYPSAMFEIFDCRNE